MPYTDLSTYGADEKKKLTVVETGDATICQRILDYNEDDCRAMRVLRDSIDGLTLKPRGPHG